MRPARVSAVAFALVTGVLVLGAVTAAHHSRAGYDTAKERLTTHDGVVAEVIIDPKTYTKPWVTPAATIRLVPGTELWEDFCVPSDYNSFNNDVYLPVATGGQNAK
jgi:hypothetical protein